MTFARSLAVVLCCSLICGCGYNIGTSFPTQVQTVAVPIFENTTFRPGIELQLTEAVHREIKNRTHFRLVPESEAQTLLSGKIVQAQKRVLGENGLDDPRMLEFSLTLRVVWEDLQTGRILAEQDILLDPGLVSLQTTGNFAPEVGQSLATARHDATTRMAERIVDLMEFAW